MQCHETPFHIAIIPDGNRRWAKKNSLPVHKGHLEGYIRTKEIIEEAKKLGVQYLTFWVFSTENWLREEDEVCDLLALVYRGLKDLSSHVYEQKIRFLHLGRKDRLDKKLSALIVELEHATQSFTGLCLTLAIDYGGEDELFRAEKLLRDSSDTSKRLKDFLDTTRISLPDPDFIIRTSGEQRTSGFMPLQSAYSEWYFETVLFPEFTLECFNKALILFSQRARRFGK
jgi:undecaprenyl diphosphate synthase